MVPILSLNTPDDPISPPEDMILVASSSLNGEIAFSDFGGHCSDDPNEDEFIARWILDKLGVSS